MKSSSLFMFSSDLQRGRYGPPARRTGCLYRPGTASEGAPKTRQPQLAMAPDRGSQMARLGGFVNKLLSLTTGLGLAVATVAPVAQAQPADTTHISTEPLFTKR